jgi:prolyl oligopeptidase
MPLQPLARSGPSYPPAPRQDLVEDMFGHPVADPYRWLEDADSLETKGWSEAQDLLYSDALAAWPGRDIFRDRLGKLLGAGAVSPPVWRGDRQFFMRRNGEQEHAVLLTVDPDGTERVLLDPMTLDPSGLTTLDAWQPSKEGALLAYQVSEGGTEESVIRVMAVTTGEIVDGPIDRARYSPIAFLPGGEKYYYVRRLAPEGLPAGEEQFHRRVWLHTVGTDADSDVLIFGDGLVATNYYGFGEHGWSLAHRHGIGRNGASQRYVAGRPVDVGPGVTGLPRRSGVGGRPEQSARRTQWPGLRLHRPQCSTRSAVYRGSDHPRVR